MCVLPDAQTFKKMRDWILSIKDVQPEMPIQFVPIRRVHTIVKPAVQVM
jgi:hypothetical protein